MYEAVFPATTCLESVEYYVSFGTVTGERVTQPLKAPNNSFVADSVTEVLTPAAFDMESGDGWSVTDSDGLSGGTWELAIPDDPLQSDNGPPADFDGSGRAWVTDADDSGSGDSDVDAGSTVLVTPPIDLSAAATGAGRVTVSYAIYFLASDFSGFALNDGDGSMEVEITDDGQTWHLLESLSESTVNTPTDFRASWKPREFVLDDAPISFTDSVRMRFTVTDNAPLDPTFGDSFLDVTEAAVDALAFTYERCNETPSTCQGDATGDGRIDLADLLAVLGAFGETVSGGSVDGDFDLSGVVDLADLLVVLGEFGVACP